MAGVTPELHDAVERAYRVFPAQRLVPPIGVCKCSCCVSDENERLMAATPRRQLALFLIREFTNSAHGQDDHLLRHFLPRMFELTAEGANVCSLDDTLGFKGLGLGTARVPHANYRVNWSPAEIATIDAFYLALFRRALAARPARFLFGDGTRGLDEVDIGWTLETIAVGGGDVARLLAVWDGDASRLASLQLADFVSSLTVNIWAHGNASRVFSQFSDHAPEAEHLVADWLKRPEHGARFDGAMLDEPDAKAFDLLSRARHWATGR